MCRISRSQLLPSFLYSLRIAFSLSIFASACRCFPKSLLAGFSLQGFPWRHAPSQDAPITEDRTRFSWPGFVFFPPHVVGLLFPAALARFLRPSIFVTADLGGLHRYAMFKAALARFPRPSNF